MRNFKALLHKEVLHYQVEALFTMATYIINIFVLFCILCVLNEFQCFLRILGKIFN